MSKTYIVDGNSLLFRSYYSTAFTGNIMTTPSGIPINAIFAFHNMINKIKKELTIGDHLYVAFDTGKPTKRKQEFEDYKAQRAPVPQELIAQMPIAREMLTGMSIHWNEKEGYEGDDLAGSMAFYASSKGDDVTLFSSDKDFLQLLAFSDRIHIRFLKKGLSETVDYTKENLHSLFGLNPDQITDFKGIAGDPSDNYSGIKGIGEKTAMKMLNEYGHLEDIIEYCKANPKSKTNQKFIDGEKDAIFFKQLATIITDMDMVDDYEKSSFKNYEKSRLSSFYMKYQLNQFLTKMDKMPGLIDDTSSQQISLFESGDDAFSNEANRTASHKREFVTVTSLAEVNESILGLTYDSSSSNENKSDLLGFALGTEHHIYYLSKENAKNDKAFNEYLESNEQKSVYDLKGLFVLLNRNGFAEIKNVDFDLLLATYIINPDCGQKKEQLFLSYQIEFDYKQNLSQQVMSYVLDLRENIISDLKKNDSLSLLTKVELPLAIVLAKMEIEGFPIDTEVLKTIDEEYTLKLSSLERMIYQDAGKEFNINSPKQLEQILFTDMGIQKFKGEKGTGIDVLLSHQDDHPIFAKIIEYRLYNKLVSGYTKALPDHVLEDGKIHAIYNQALTSTGRLSMSEPNLQNISIRNEEGKAIRKAFFYPNKEYLMLSLDYSQIELRVLAHIGNIKALKEIFSEGKDIHRATAAKVFNVPFDEVTSEMRRKAKAVNFGIVYGISPFGLSQQLDISREEASTLIKQFKAAFEGIDEYQASCIEFAKTHGYVTTILNRRRYLKDINSSNHALRSFSERAAVNTTIQGSAADLIKVAMINCQKMLQNYKTKIILQIHDELIFKVPKDEIDIVMPLLKEGMEKAIPLSVPLLAEGSASDNWYEAH
ncbi:MAG: DNA polymerase I [Bacilli bacterium]